MPAGQPGLSLRLAKEWPPPARGKEVRDIGWPPSKEAKGLKKKATEKAKEKARQARERAMKAGADEDAVRAAAEKARADSRKASYDAPFLLEKQPAAPTAAAPVPAVPSPIVIPAAAADAMGSTSPWQRNDDRPEVLDADRARPG